MKLVRFSGDPTGYLLRPEDEPAEDERPSGWVVAKVGSSDVEVRVNLDQAYILETAPEWFRSAA